MPRLLQVAIILGLLPFMYAHERKRDRSYNPFFRQQLTRLTPQVNATPNTADNGYESIQIPALVGTPGSNAYK